MAMTPDSFRTTQQRPRTSASPTPSPTSTNPSPHRRRPRRRLMTEEISELYLSDHQVWPQQQAMPWPCSLNSPFLNMYGEEGEYDDELVLAAAAQAARAATVADGGDVPAGSTSSWPLGVRRSSFASASSSDSVSDDEDPGGRVRRGGGRRGGRSAASRWSSEWIEFKTMRTASDLARSASFSALPVTAAPSVPTAAAVPAFLLPSTFATRPLQLASAASTSTSQLPSRDCPPPPAPVRRHHHYQHHTNVAQDAPLWTASTEDLAASSTSNLASSSPLQPRMQRPGAAQRARNRSARVILLDSSTSPILGGASPVADSPSQNAATSTFSPFSSTPEPSGTATSGAASSSYASTVTNSALASSIPLVRRRDHSGPFSRSDSRLASARSDAAHSLLLAANAAINRDLNNMQSSDATGLPTIPTAAALLEDNGDLEEGSSLIRRVMRRRRLDRERERERDRARERERERQRDETRPLLEAEDRERERRSSRSRPRWGLSSEHNSRVEALIMDWQLIEPNAASAVNGPPIIRRSPSPIDFQTESLTQEPNTPSVPAIDAVGAAQAAEESPTSLRPEGARAAFQIPPWRIPTSPGTGSSRPLPESTPAPTDARDVPSTSSARPSNFAQSRPSSLLPPHSSTLNVNVNLNRSSTSSSPGSSSSSGATPVRDEFRARRSPRRMDSVTDADLQAFESHLAVLRASSLTGLTPPGGLSESAEGSSPAAAASGGGAVHARSEGNSPESRSPVSTIRLPTSLGRITPRIPLSRSTAPHVDWRRHSESGQEGVPSDQSPRGTPETYFPTSRWFPPSMRRIGDGSADELVAPDAAAGISPTAILSDRSAEEVEQGRALARLQASQAETWTGSAAERDFQRLLNERDGSGSSEDAVPEANEASREVVAPTASSVAAFLGRQSEQLSNSEARLARLLEVLRTPQVGERDESRGNLSVEREGGRAPLASLRTRLGSDASADRIAPSEVASSEALPTFTFTASVQDDEGRDLESQVTPEPSMTVDTEMKILDLLKEEDKAQLGSSGVELVEAVDSRAASLYRSSIRSALAARARYHVPTQPRLPSTSAEYPLRFEVWQANGRDVDSVFKLNSPRGILRDDWRSWRSGQSRSASVVLRFLYIDPSSSGATATASTATAASSSLSSSSATAANSDIPTGSSNPDNALDAFARRQGERRAALAALTASGPFGRSQLATASARASGGEASATASSSNSLTATETQQLTTHAQNLRRFLELLHEEMAVLEETFRRHNPRSEIPTGTGTRTSARTLNSAASGTARRSISAVASSFASAIPGPVSMTAYSARRAAATASTIARVQGLGDGAAGSLLPSQVRSLERLASTTGHGPERLAVVSSLGQNEIRALREIISSQVLGSGAPSLPTDSARGLLDSNEEERDVSLPEIGASGAVILPKVGLSEEEHELVQTCLDRIHSLSGMGEPSQAGLDLAFTSTGGPLQTLMQKRCEAFVRSALTAGGAQPGSIPRGRTFNMSSLELRMARRHGVEIEGLAFVSEEPMPNEVVCSFEKCDRTELVEILRSSLDRNRPGYSLLADKGARLDPSAGDAGGDIGNANLMRQWTPAAYFKTRTNYVHLDFSSGTLSTSSPNVASTSTSTSASVQIRPDGRTSELGEYCVSGRFLTLILLSSATAAGRARGGRGGAPVAPEEEISLNFVGAKGFGMRSTSEGRTI